MTKLIDQLKSAVSQTVLFVAAIVLAGIGFAFLGLLTLFALIALGVGLIAAPFAAQHTADTAA